MAVLRGADNAVASAALAAVWDDAEQRERALATLIDDGLIVSEGSRFRLP